MIKRSYGDRSSFNAFNMLEAPLASYPQLILPFPARPPCLPTALTDFQLSHWFFLPRLVLFLSLSRCHDQGLKLTHQEPMALILPRMRGLHSPIHHQNTLRSPFRPCQSIQVRRNWISRTRLRVVRTVALPDREDLAAPSSSSLVLQMPHPHLVLNLGFRCG